jgi:hypothetical protein
MKADEDYLSIIREAIAVCHKYKPKFGTRGKEGITPEQFRALYRADPFYSWFGLDSPLVYAAHKAAGGITSVYRQIGTGVERLYRQILQDCLGQTAEESNWSYFVPTTSGKKRKLSLDGRIALGTIRVPQRKDTVFNWLDQAKETVALSEESRPGILGCVFECRQAYKSKDAKRQNADVANAANAYAHDYLPCVMLFSLQIDSDVAERYVRAQWLLLKGSLKGTALSSTYAFCRDVLGYDLAGFFERNKLAIKEDVERVFQGLLQ